MMNKTLYPLLAGCLALGLAAQAADAGPRQNRWDQYEDKLDKQENYADQQSDHGKWDRREDRLDNLESRRDRRGKRTPRFAQRWERYSYGQQSQSGMNSPHWIQGEAPNYEPELPRKGRKRARNRWLSGDLPAYFED